MDSYRNIFLFLFCLLGSETAKGVPNVSMVKAFLEEGLSPLNHARAMLENEILSINSKRREIESYKREVETRLAKIPPKCLNGDLLEHTVILKNWNFYSCVNVTDDMLRASELATVAGILSSNLSTTAYAHAKAMLDCPTYNVDKTVQCYGSNVKELKDFMVSFKAESLPIVSQSVRVLQTLRVDFDSCIGIPLTSKVKIENQLKAAENC